MAGFGNSKKLAAQFYFKDMTVLKVMFGAISRGHGADLRGHGRWPVGLQPALGESDLSLAGHCRRFDYGRRVHYWRLLPGHLAGWRGNLEAGWVFFVLGVIFGIFLFGETVSNFNLFWNSSYLGRFTIPEWLGLPTAWWCCCWC